MKVLFSAEGNIGGGAISNICLAKAMSEFADVAFFGIDYKLQESNSIKYFESRPKRPLSIGYLCGYYNACKVFKPDILHATGMYTGLIALIIRALTKNKFKIIMTLRHTNTNFRFNSIAKKLVVLLKEIDLVHYLTEYQRVYYWNYGLRPFNFKIIPNIIHTKVYTNGEVDELRRKLICETSSEFLIVYVGRLTENKQIHFFIETLKILNQNNHNVGGIIVGKGDEPYVKKLKNLVKKYEINDKILFAGFSNQPELYIKACDFGLFPTLSEALPRFIIESFSQHKTLVVSNHPSVYSIVKDEQNVLVVKAHESEDYAEKCIKLIQDPQLLKKLETGAEFIYNNFYKADYVINEYKKMYLTVGRFQ
jgi:L-malate glycosyltransferase